FLLIKESTVEAFAASIFLSALRLEDAGVVKMLISVGVDPIMSDREGHTPLQIVSRRGNIKLARILLDAGADVNATDRNGYGTALQAAAESDNIELVQILLQAGADVNVFTARTALQAAADNGNSELAQILLEAGADVNAPAYKVYELTSGMTALQAGVESGNIELVQILLKAGG